jgi:hypothetical protein
VCLSPYCRALQRKGVNLISVPVGRKEAADKAILVDMLFFAMDCLKPNDATAGERGGIRIRLLLLLNTKTKPSLKHPPTPQCADLQRFQRPACYVTKYHLACQYSLRVSTPRGGSNWPTPPSAC